jgi:hypothetical protein
MGPDLRSRQQNDSTASHDESALRTRASAARGQAVKAVRNMLPDEPRRGDRHLIHSAAGLRPASRG